MPDSPPPPPFDGWDTPHFTPIPDQLFDEWLPHLSEAELKCLLYIMRRTFGFKKNADAISLSQMAEGIVKTDGTRLDWGAGVTRRSVQRALPSLLEKGLIEAYKQTTAAGDPDTTVYRLRLRGRGQNVPTQGLSIPTPGDNLSGRVETESPPQETAVQDTVNKSGLDPNLLAAIRTFAGKLHQSVTPARIAELAEAAGTLARWQAASAGARSLDEVEAALENGR